MYPYIKKENEFCQQIQKQNKYAGYHAIVFTRFFSQKKASENQIIHSVRKIKPAGKSNVQNQSSRKS